MSRALKYSLRTQETLTADIERLFDTAHLCFLSSVQTYSKYIDILDSQPDLPRWLVSYLDGYYDARRAQIVRHHVVFGKWYLDKFYCADDKDHPCYIERISSWKKYTNIPVEPHFYWRKALNKEW